MLLLRLLLYWQIDQDFQLLGKDPAKLVENWERIVAATTTASPTDGGTVLNHFRVQLSL